MTAMSQVAAFLAMGGYALYVWPAYGAAVAALGGLALLSWRRYRASEKALAAAQQSLGRRR
jgi:heme exporter protein D